MLNFFNKKAVKPVEAICPQISFFYLPNNTIQIIADWPNSMDTGEVIRCMSNLVSHMSIGQLYDTTKEAIQIKEKHTGSFGIANDIDKNVVSFIMKYYASLQKEVIDKYENDNDVILRPSDVFRSIPNND